MNIDALPRLSIVTPAYNECENLALLHERLTLTLAGTGMEWEWIVVDDHSSDDSLAKLARLAEADTRVHGIRLARNSGSHAALMCGLEHAHGDCVVALAGDLQDPPEVIPGLLKAWRDGAQVVWAVREKREGEAPGTIAFSRMYYWLMRHFADMRDMPTTGADFFLADKRVVQTLRDFRESNVNLFALLSWIGFRQVSIGYTKEARAHGVSGWTMRKKLKLLVDSITSFTYLPIRLMSYVGILTAILGLVYAAIVIVNAFVGNPAAGWSSLMVVVLVLGGAQMLMIGVLGEYVWRALDESRRRPRYPVEQTVGGEIAGGDQTR